MPTTRAQEKAAVSGGSNKPSVNRPKSAKKAASSKVSNEKQDALPRKKRQRKDDEPDGATNGQHKSIKNEQKTAHSASDSKVEKLIEAHGRLPLEVYELPDPLEPSTKNMLANLFNAMLTSARIAHGLATKTVKLLIDKDYHDLTVLKKSTWDERTVVLTEGGYTHYREKTATQLGELAELLTDKYKGDLNTIPEKQGKSLEGVKKGLAEIKGIGNVGIDVFCDSAQAYWTFLAPFLDQRSLGTVEKLGLVKEGDDVLKALWIQVGEDPVRMARLANAITYVRLEGKEKEFV